MLLWKRFAYFILITYLVVGFWLFPVIGSVALACMLAPVLMAFTRGREWCGRYCPRGSLWDSMVSRFSRNKPLPVWTRAKGTRIFMVVMIFTVFGVQMVYAWPDPAAIGLVFLRIIFITTLVGIALGIVYKPRAWCNICPMGSLAAWVSHHRKPKPLLVHASCVSCGLCARSCPMQLTPHVDPTFTNPDCLKCGHCVDACPKGALRFKRNSEA